MGMTSPTLETGNDIYRIENLKRIRKLTPKECFRLQGWTDEYFERAAFVNNDSQLYKQAGNGVTVNVIQAIAEKFKEEHNDTTRSEGSSGDNRDVLSDV